MLVEEQQLDFGVDLPWGVATQDAGVVLCPGQGKSFQTITIDLSLIRQACNPFKSPIKAE